MRNPENPFPEVDEKSISGSGVGPGLAVSVVVEYERPYKTIPRVMLTMSGAPGGSSNLVPRALNRTLTGFTLYVYNTGSTAATWTNLPITWVAYP